MSNLSLSRISFAPKDSGASAQLAGFGLNSPFSSLNAGSLDPFGSSGTNTGSLSGFGSANPFAPSNSNSANTIRQIETGQLQNIKTQGQMVETMMMQQSMQAMLHEMMALMAGRGLGSSSGSDSGGSPLVSGAAGSGGSSGAGSGGFSASSSSSSGVDPNGGGAAAVKLAQSKIGEQAQNVSMANYSHAGGVTNDCADFVSGILADTEGFKKNSGDANVEQFQKDLVSQGWKPVSQAQAQPGDVAIILGGGVQHTELVSQAGAKQDIGSNGTSQEAVSTDDVANWASGVTYYHKG